MRGRQAKHCVDCQVNADCGADKACLAQKRVAKVACGTDKDCPVVCAKALGMCVACNTDGECLANHFCGGDHACHPDVCAAHACAAGLFVACKGNGSGFGVGKSCDDGNVCTADSCEAVKGCVHLPATGTTTACDDGNA